MTGNTKFLNLFKDFSDGIFYSPINDHVSSPRDKQMYNPGDRVTVDRQTFHQRLSAFTYGLFDGLGKSQDVVLSGGSMNLLVSSCFDLDYINNCDSDLDLFMAHKGDTKDLLRRLESVLRHFADYATKNGLRIRYIVRGMLIEVMIQHQPRIQIICARGESVEQFISTLDLVHVQIYYDGEDVYLTDKAVKALQHQVTYATRYPVKSTRVTKSNQRGYDVIHKVIVTHLDQRYFTGLTALEQLKYFIDHGITLLPHYYEMFLLYKDIDKCMEEVTIQANRKWDPFRVKHHTSHLFVFDLDIFDISVRLDKQNPSDFGWRDTHVEDVQILALENNDILYSPAVFIVRDLPIERLYTYGNDMNLLIIFKWEKSVLETLKRLVKSDNWEDIPQCLFVFGISHSMQSNGTIHNHMLTDYKDVLFSVTFKSVQNVKHKNLMFEIVELTSQEPNYRFGMVPPQP